MGRQHSPTTVATLNAIHKAGSANYLDIERTTSLGGSSLKRLSKLLQDGYIEPLKKEYGQLKRYRLTASGRNVIGAIKERQQRLTGLSMPVWKPPAWIPARAGAMQAMQIPSRGL